MYGSTLLKKKINGKTSYRDKEVCAWMRSSKKLKFNNVSILTTVYEYVKIIIKKIGTLIYYYKKFIIQFYSFGTS